MVPFSVVETAHEGGSVLVGEPEHPIGDTQLFRRPPERLREEPRRAHRRVAKRAPVTPVVGVLPRFDTERVADHAAHELARILLAPALSKTRYEVLALTVPSPT